MKNTISKIAMFTILILNGTAKSQEFYTCIPNDDWVKDLSKGVQRSDEEVRRLARETKRSDEEVKRLARETRRSDEEVKRLAKDAVSDYHIQNEAKKVIRDEYWFNNLYDLRSLQEKFKIAETQVNNDSAWDLMYHNDTSGTLSQGIYRVVVAGGQGGRGGNATVNKQGCRLCKCSKTYYGGDGGKGEVNKKVFLVKQTSSFNATIGSEGTRGGDELCDDCEIWGKYGSNGKSSSITGAVSLTARGGNKGKPAFNDDYSCGGIGQTSCGCRNGYDGTSYPDGNVGDGYVRIYKYKG